VQSLGDRLWAGLTERGCETMCDRSAETGAGIVTFRKPGAEAHIMVRHMRESGFIVAPRQGWVRVSPHFYISPQEIDRFVAEV
jgi:cysteine desulfurase/selenocysteine lyase